MFVCDLTFMQRSYLRAHYIAALLRFGGLRDIIHNLQFNIDARSSEVYMGVSKKGSYTFSGRPEELANISLPWLTCESCGKCYGNDLPDEGCCGPVGFTQATVDESVLFRVVLNESPQSLMLVKDRLRWNLKPLKATFKGLWNKISSFWDEVKTECYDMWFEFLPPSVALPGAALLAILKASVTHRYKILRMYWQGVAKSPQYHKIFVADMIDSLSDSVGWTIVTIPGFCLVSIGLTGMGLMYLTSVATLWQMGHRAHERSQTIKMMSEFLADNNVIVSGDAGFHV